MGMFVFKMFRMLVVVGRLCLTNESGDYCVVQIFVLYCTTIQCTVLYIIVQYCTVQNITVQYNTIQYMYYTVLCSTHVATFWLKSCPVFLLSCNGSFFSEYI